jgi:uncharacterized membrane protein
MNFIKEYAVAIVVFLIMDGIWLGFVASGLYKKELGYLMTNNPNWIAAIVFYLLFIVGLVFFVIDPAIAKDSIKYALLAGMLFGLISYSTYDLTNLATIKDWPISITIIDLIWGASLSGIVSSVSYYIITAFNLI